MQPHRDHHFSEGRALPLARRVFGSLHRTMLLHRQLIARKLSERDVPAAQALCLKELGHHDGITQRDLAELLMVSRPNVTVMLKKMEKAGLVERSVDEADQRYTRIHLTARGVEMHNSMHRAIDDITAETIGALSEKDQAELARLLGLLGERMAEVLGDSGSARHASGYWSQSGEEKPE